MSWSRSKLALKSATKFFACVSYCVSYQHIWQWHGTFEDCQSVRPRVWDQFSISIVLPVLSHGRVCTVIVSLLDILGVVFHICIHWPLIGFRLAIRGLGRIEGPRKASNMLIWCLPRRENLNEGGLYLTFCHPFISGKLTRCWKHRTEKHDVNDEKEMSRKQWERGKSLSGWHTWSTDGSDDEVKGNVGRARRDLFSINIKKSCRSANTSPTQECQS